MAFGTPGSSKRRKHSKPGSTTMRGFHFRIEANTAGARKLHQALDLGLELRNDQAMALESSRQEARAAKLRGEEPHYLSAFELKKMVAGDCLHPKFAALHSQVRQDISMRVTEGQKRWFEAMKQGRRHVRPPGLMARKNFRSITYPQYGTAAHIKNGVLHLSKLGEFRLIGWRKMRGSKKCITVKFKEGHFWAIVMCEVQERDVCRPFAVVKQTLLDTGVDPGLAAVLTDSVGTSYETPKPLKQAKATLRHIQKDVSRKFEMRKKLHLKTLNAARAACAPGELGRLAPVAAGLVESLRKIPYSKRLKLNIKKLACAHTKVERIRCDVARKNARKIEKNFARAAVEEHSLQFMVKNPRQAKATADVAIGKQKHALRSALGKGRYFEASNRRIEGGNSQTCLCGASVPKTLKDRWHSCPECGLGVDQPMPRDQMSAIICQYETFGTIPNLTEVNKFKQHSTPGLGVLERVTLQNAVQLLETRRGEGKGRGSESCTAESHTVVKGKAKGASRKSPGTSVQSAEVGTKVQTKAVAFESSVKRPAPGESVIRNTAGGALASSAEAKTAGHVSSARTCLVEAKVRVTKKTRSTRRQLEVPRSLPRSPLLQVGE
jgi:hypothetical protein